MINRTNKILIWAIAAITVIGALVWDLYTPYTTDDNYYREVLKPHSYNNDGWISFDREIETFADAWESIDNHRDYNGRLANFIHILFQPTGRVPEATVLGLLIGACFLMLYIVSRRGSGVPQPLGIASAAVIFWLVPTWHDQFQSLDFQINYIPASLITLILIYYAPALKESGKGRLAALAALAYICGWMHEGFGCVGMVLFAVYALTEGAGSRKRILIIMACLAAGVATGLLAGTCSRIAYETEGAMTLSRQLFVQLTLAMWPELLASALLVLYIIARRHKARALAVEYAPVVAAMWAGVAMAAILGMSNHIFWIAHLFAAVVLCSLCCRAARKIGPKVQAGIGVLFTIAYAAWMVELCMWSKITGDEVRKVFSIHGTPGPDKAKVFYMDYHRDADIPFRLMGVVRQPLDHPSCAFLLGSYLRGNVGSVLVLPPELEGRTFEEWPAISADGKLRGVYPMMAVRDSSDMSLMMYFGDVRNNITPAERFFIAVKGAGASDSIEAGVGLLPVVLPDGSLVYRCDPEPLPRSIAGRKFISADVRREPQACR